MNDYFGDGGIAEMRPKIGEKGVKRPILDYGDER